MVHRELSPWLKKHSPCWQEIREPRLSLRLKTRAGFPESGTERPEPLEASCCPSEATVGGETSRMLRVPCISREADGRWGPKGASAGLAS